MQIALVIGSTISTIKDESIRGRKAADRPQGGYGREYDRRAVRRCGYGQRRGTGDLVLITDGSSARFTSQTRQRTRGMRSSSASSTRSKWAVKSPTGKNYGLPITITQCVI